MAGYYTSGGGTPRGSPYAGGQQASAPPQTSAAYGAGNNPNSYQFLTGSSMYGNAPVNTGVQSPYSSFTAYAPSVSPDQENARKQQEAFIAALQAQMNGQGPNLAQAQLNQATQQNQSMTAGAIAAQRGINPGLAAREIQQAGSNIQQQSAGQAGTLRAQQELATQALLGQTLGGVRGQDIGAQQVIGGQNLQAQGLNAQTAEANLNANLQQEAMNIGQTFNPSTLVNGLVGGGAQGGGAALAKFALAAHGGEISDFRAGGNVPGKAKVEGDDARNDTVPAKLSPGEIVIPRSVSQSDDAPQKAADFVAAIKKRKGAEAGPGRHLAKLKQIEKRVAALEGR